MFIIQVWILCFRITFLSRCLLAATRRLFAATRRLVTYPQQFLVRLVGSWWPERCDSIGPKAVAVVVVLLVWRMGNTSTGPC